MDKELTLYLSKMSRVDRKSFAESKTGITFNIQYCACCGHCKPKPDFAGKKMCAHCRGQKNAYHKQKKLPKPIKLTDAECSEIALKEASLEADKLFPL